MLRQVIKHIMVKLNLINNGTIVFSSATGGIPPNYEYSLDGVNYQSSPNFSIESAEVLFIVSKSDGFIS